MKKEIHYTVKKGRLIQEILFSMPTAFLLIVCFYVVSELYEKWAALIFILAAPVLLIYMQVKALILTLQYSAIDKNKQLIINAERTAFEIFNSEKRYVIKSEDIHEVEIREQKSLGKFGNYAYIIIRTNDNHYVIVTNLTVPRLIYDPYLEKVLAKKPRTYIKSSFNTIGDLASQVLI